MATVTTYLDSDLRKMSDAERHAATLKLVQGAQRKPNGEIRDLELQIKAFEDMRGVCTAKMRELVRSGAMREDDAVCHWLILADLLDDLRATQAAW